MERRNAFVDDAVQWRRSCDEGLLRRLIRSEFSGVAHDAAAAYATLSERTGGLLDAIDRGRLVLPAADRDAVLRFVRRIRRIEALPQDAPETTVRETVGAAFELPCGEAGAPRRTPNAFVEIELAAATEPEEAASAPPWTRHFSASALNTYAECARKWFYRYACGAVEDRGSSASAYGTAFHLALEDFHGEFPRPSRRDDTAMRRRIRDCVTWAFERSRDAFATAVEFELQVRRARRTAQRYVDWLLLQEREAPFEVLGREVPAAVELGGRAFVGFIDRLDRDERSGDTVVVDYKTGSIAMTAAEYAQKVRRFRDFQLPFYYWARTAAGDAVCRLALVPLKDALLDVRPIVLDVGPQSPPPRRDDAARGSISLDDLERSRARMIELSERLASGGSRRFEPTSDPAACAYCNYAVACADRPPFEGRRFGS